MTVGFIQTGSESGWRAANTSSFKETATADKINLNREVGTQFLPDRTMRDTKEIGWKQPACRKPKAELRLRTHPGSGKNVQDPIRREDSSAGSARGCKVRVGPGSHHRPATDAGAGETRRRI
jgi:hypothetical protein